MKIELKSKIAKNGQKMTKNWKKMINYWKNEIIIKNKEIQFIFILKAWKIMKNPEKRTIIGVKIERKKGVYMGIMAKSDEISCFSVKIDQK